MRHFLFRFLLVSLVLAGFVPVPGRAIIEGEMALEGEFPSTAALVKSIESATPALFGAGILVGDQWVLTAAHSLVTESIASFEIWFGVTDLTDSSSRIVRRALAIYRHPDFTTSDGTSENDLALLLLDRPVSGIDPLPVSTDPDDSSAGDAGVVAGWGTTTPGVATASPVLNRTDAEIVTNGFANGYFGGILTDNHLAARDPAFVGMPCFGDSGGPLVRDVGGIDTLVGIVSFGSADCDDSSVPSIYTHLARYDDWISAHLDLTATPSRLTVTGRNKVIRSGDRSPRRADRTDFGTLRSRKGKRSRSFRLENGGGLLTIRAARVSGRRFSLVRSPAPVVAPLGNATTRIRFRSAGKRRTWRSWIRLYTNDPATPVYSFRIGARTR